jgi:crotonobetainyl-CoA:carnitine CoA-transferase CaiB-like acyl-CoA transferase
MDGVFDGLKIIELGQGIPAAFCTKLFADLGAEVVKVEPPGGDVLRARGPFADGEPGVERSGLFAYANTNKLGLTLDVTDARGRELFLALVRAADVLVENNAPVWLQAQELDYKHLRAAGPALVMTSITPFGQDGPWRDHLANDFIVQHTSAIAWSNGARALDLEAEPPFVLPGYAGDFATGLAAASTTMVALFGRDADGAGCHVDVAAQEVLAMHGHLELGWTNFAGQVPSRSASANPPIPYVGQQPAADGYIDVVVRTEEHWRKFLEVLGNPDWGENELFATMETRSRYWDALEPLIQQETRRFTKQELFERSQANGVSAAAVNTVADAARSEHFAERGVFVETAHPEIGRVRIPGPPIAFGTDVWRTGRAPLLGEHNDALLRGRLGLSAAELDALRAAGVISS